MRNVYGSSQHWMTRFSKSIESTQLGQLLTVKVIVSAFAIFLLASLTNDVKSQTIIYSNDFQAGWNSWTLTGCCPDWRRDNNNTGSSNTGPNGGSVNGTVTNGNYYAYLEVSGSGQNGSGNLTSPSITAATTPTLSFRYHMYGSAMGTLQAQVNSGSGWVTVWTISGQQQGSSNDAWSLATVVLTGYTGNIQIRFRGTAGGSWQGDMAVDDVLLTTNACTPPSPPNAPGTTVACNSTASLTASGAPSGGTYAWYSDAGGTNLVGSGTPFVTPALTSNATYYVAATDGPPSTNTLLSNDFQSGWNSWTLTGCCPDWQRDNNNTGSSNTGPNGGSVNGTVTNGNYYAYLEVSGSGQNGSGNLTSPSVNVTSTPTLSFRYHMYGSAMGTLQAQVNSGSGWVTVWTISGQQQGSSNDAWSLATVVLTGYTGNIQIRFRGTAGGSWQGDMAVDDVLLTEPGGFNCISNLTAVNVTVNPLAQPIASGTTITCGNTASLTASGSSSYNWYSDAGLTNLVGTGSSFTTPVLTTNTTYYVQAGTGVCASAATSVVVTVNNLATPTAGNQTVTCGSTANLTASGSTGNYVWYSDAGGTNQVGTGASFTTPALTSSTTYYVSASNGGAPSQLSTIFSSGNNQQGSMFDITTNSETLVVDGLTIYPNSTGTYNFSVYYKTGTYVGSETNSGPWTLVGTYTITTTTGATQYVDVADFNLNPSTTYGIHVVLSGGLLNYTNGANTYNNADMTITTGVGLSGVFGPSVYSPRTWNGTVHYSVSATCESALDPATVTVNDIAAPTNPIATPTPVCEGSTSTLSASPASGGNTVRWYSGSSGGSVLATGLSYTTPTLNTPGTVTYYAASYNSSNGCESSSRTAVNITVHEAPTAPTGITVTGTNPICNGNSVTLTATGGTVGDGATYEWRAGTCGSGTVLGTNVSISVSPSANTIYYVRRVPTGANACSAATSCASQLITVTDPPAAFAGVDKTQCGLGAYQILDATTGNGTLGTPGWTTNITSGTATFAGLNTLTPTITPTSTTGSLTMTINVDGIGPCSGDTDVMTMSWTAAPTATAGPDIESCGASAVYFTGSSATSGSTVGWTLLSGQPGESGTGTIIDPSTTNDPTTWGFQPTSATGVRYVRLTSAPPAACAAPNITDDLIITWDEIPSVSVTSPLNSCTGGDAITLSGTSAGTGTLNWSIVTPTSGSASFTAGTGTDNPTFDPTTTSGQHTVEFSITGTGACVGNNDAELMTVNWDNPPTFTAGTDFTSCETTPVSVTDAAITSAFTSMTWVDLGTGSGSGSFTTTHPTDPAAWVFTPTSAGTINLQLQVIGVGSVCTAAVTDEVTLTFDPEPTVDAGSVTTVCTGTSAITLSGATASNISFYTWSETTFPTTGTLTQGTLIDNATFTPGNGSGSANLLVTVMGTGTCSTVSADDSRIVNWNTAPVIDEVDVLDVSDCNTDNGAIAIFVTGVEPMSYSIDNGANYFTNQLFQNLAVDSYNVIVEDGNGCTTTYASNPVDVNGPSTPVFTVSSTNSLCNGAEDGIFDVTVTSGGTAWYAIEAVSAQKTYQDTALAVNQPIQLDVIAGFYNITVTDVFGCSTTTGPYAITEPSAVNVSTTVVNNTNCTGTDGSITVTASGGTPGYQYSFNGGSFSGTNVFTNLGTGSYTIIVRDNNNCEVPFEEEIGGPFVVSAGNDRYLCEGSSLTMNAQLDVNTVTSAGGAAGYTMSSISHNPRTPGSWNTVPLGDDAVSGWVNIGFSFTFFGNSYTQYRISSNGFITFNNSTASGCCAGQNLPNGAAPNNLIALCWEDLNPNNGGTIRYGTFGTSPNRVMVIEYNGIYHFGGDYPITGQILLFESTNNIELHNTSVPSDLSSGSGDTQGIENATGTQATTSHNAQTGWTETNSAYLFEPPIALGTINYSWSPSTGLSNANILNPTVSGITSDQTYTLQTEIVGVCTLDDEMTVFVSGLGSETSGTFGTAPNVSTATDVICNGDDDGCISVLPSTGHAPYLLEGPNGEIQVYQGRMKEVTVSNTTGAALTDYQVGMTVSYEGQMRPDFGDLRFYDGTTGNLGDLLYYWVESYTLSSTATVYVKVPNIPNGGTSVYMLYGNSTLTSQSDPDNTLLLYEDMMAPPSGTLYGNASYIDHQFTRLTQAINSTNGQLDYNLNPSTGGNGYVADFEFWIGGGSGADALYQYSDCATRPTTEDASTGGYAFVYDTWENQHQIKWNGTTTATNAESNHDNSTWREAKVEQFNTTGRIYLDGVLRLTGTVTADNVGNSFGFGARTGGANNEHRVRNIRVRKLVSPAPTATFGSEEVSDNQFCGLSPGNYSISVWDAADCDITEVSIPIAEPTALAIASIDVTDTWCYTTNNGELDLTVTGGTQITPPPPYIYDWSGPSSFTSTAEDLTGLDAGLYGIIVADDNGCTATSNSIVNTSTPINGSPFFTWTGNTDQLWQDETNWDCGLPDATSEVIIPGAPIGGNTPIIQNGITGDVLNIDIQGNTSDLIDIQNGGLLRIWEP